MALYYEEKKPIVATKAGLLRGLCYGGVNVFAGVRYAEAARFRMPEEVTPWEGVRDALSYGPVMKQMRPFRMCAYEEGINNPCSESEDCQYLNLWAPAEGSGLPVFVYMHGGGYFSGSSTEYNFFNGFNMARKGNVVFVSMNHRLNLVGHLNLADYGAEFENSVNLGLADLVVCLRWIRENIAAFGGNPDNVTICGHSGGGGKVLSMYQIREAKDLFTRGICMSGCLDNGPETTEEDSRALAKAMLDHMGITAANIGKIYEVSYEEILGAYQTVARPLRAQGVNVGMAPLKNDWFGGFPIEEGFMEWSRDKALMFGSTLGEFNFKVSLPEDCREVLTEDGKLDLIRKRFGEGSDRLAGLFREAYPGHDLIDLMYLDADFRRPTCETARIKAEGSSVPPYVYLFAYNLPTQGRITPWHGSDIPYALCNAEISPVCNEAVYGERMADIFENSYLNFIRCGDPGNRYLPEWKPYTAGHRATMVIDRDGGMLKEAYDEELIALYKKLCPPLNFSPEL